MANTVIALKKSGTTSAAPLSLANGELAINYADGKLFYKNVTGSIVAITSGGASSNSFATINANGSLITAVSNNSTLTFVAGQNIGITSDIINDIITLDANLTPANNFANTKLSNGTVTLAGSLTTTEQMYVNSQITITPLGGSEGGEIRLDGSGVYTDWSLDSYQNNFRVFTVTGSTVSNVNFFHAGAGSIRMGVNKADPAYTVDVAGDVNITGTYRVNGTPIAGAAGMDYAYVNTSTTASNNYASVVAANNAVGANAWANSVGTAGNNYASILIANNAVGANNWANTKLSNTDNVVFNGSLQIANTLYARDLVLSNSMIANISGNVYDLYVRNNVFIGGSITNVTQLIFNTGTNITPSVPGALTWSQDDSTLYFDMDTASNVIQHIGQDTFYLAKNQTGETITKGTVVRFAGTLGASGRLLISKATANNSIPSKYVMGVAAADIGNGADGFVYSFGKLRGIDTSMFSAGDILYLSSTVPGGLSNTMPTAPNNKVTVAAVIYSDNINGSIQIRPSFGSRLSENENAEINDVANGDILRYNSANTRFENFNENATGPAINAVAAFAKANAANLMAYSANGWANTVGTAGNNYASILIANVASAINANAVTSYSSINSYSTTIGTAGNNYTNYVGASANAYATATYYPKTGGTVSGDVVITGNLTVSGNTTYANTQTLLIGDNILTLNADLPGSVSPSENAGLEINRGNKNANAALLWIEAANAWSLTSNTLAAISTYIASNTLVETYATAGNNYVSTSLTATNNYTNSVGTAGNNYSQTLVTAANNWANTKVDSITSNGTRIWANSTVTSGIEVVNIDLAQSGVTAGVYGNSSIIPIITVDTYGRITSIANVAASGGGGGGASVNVGNTAPTSPTVGNLWWDTDSGRMYIYYTDADSSQWVDASPTQNPATFGGYYLGNRGTIGTIDGTGDIFRVHSNTISSNVSIPAGYNALAAGPLTVQNGITFTVGTGSRAVIV